MTEKKAGVIAIDLNDTKYIVKAVNALVNMNQDIDVDQNALVLAAGEGPYAPNIMQLFANSD
tara:strand:+ start:339 stop:524 length:186 start_codon:yes stop_codon:yes gene_type:complete